MGPKVEQLNMNDAEWLAKLGAVAASDAAVATTPANTNIPHYVPPVAIPAYQPQGYEPPPEMVPVVHVQTVEGAVAPTVEQIEVRFAPPIAAPVPRARKVMNTEMPNLGILDQFMNDQTVGDILVNGIHSIYIDKDGKMVDSGVRFATHEDVWDVAERIVKSVGQTMSLDRPMMDTRLPDGSRVNIIAPPMAIDGVSLSIRKFPSSQITLDSMIAGGQLTAELGKFLSECVRTRLNIIISGGTGSGKTTLLNALSASIGADERIVTIEDSAELKLQQPHVVRLESKISTSAANAHQEVSIRDLVKNALRMRPDRIVIGESRGGEALDMLQAMNTGHDGSMTTLHANTPRDALSRLETMVSLAMPQLPMRLVRQQIASSVNLIINMARCKDGVRRVMYVSEISGMEGDVVIMQDLVLYTEATTDRQGHFRWANGAPRNPLVTDAARASGMMRGMR
jgi:pilus assembly protein CpaF